MCLASGGSPYLQLRAVRPVPLTTQPGSAFTAWLVFTHRLCMPNYKSNARLRRSLRELQKEVAALVERALPPKLLSTTEEVDMHGRMQALLADSGALPEVR